MDDLARSQNVKRHGHIRVSHFFLPGTRPAFRRRREGRRADGQSPVVTDNEKDFDGVEIVNPLRRTLWRAPQREFVINTRLWWTDPTANNRRPRQGYRILSGGETNAYA
jgi:hypothetical protein